MHSTAKGEVSPSRARCCALPPQAGEFPRNAPQKRRLFKPKVRKFFIFAAFAVLVNLVSCETQSSLVLRELKTEEVLAEFPLKSREFSVSFKHSVNRSDVEEFYSVKNGKIILTAVEFSSFGAGMLTEIGKNQKLKILKNGKMRIEKIDREIPNLNYAISVAFDHFLHVNGETHNLTELGLKGKQVEFIFSE